LEIAVDREYQLADRDSGRSGGLFEPRRAKWQLRVLEWSSSRSHGRRLNDCNGADTVHPGSRSHRLQPLHGGQSGRPLLGPL